MLLSLGVLRTAMFAEPAIAEIKEVVGLIQSRNTEVRRQNTGDRIQESETRTYEPDLEVRVQKVVVEASDL